MRFEQDSLYDLNFTYHDSKLTCWKPMYYAHITFAYLIAISGLACFITRLTPNYKYLHVWFGRLYIVFMLWGTATSMLIHNTGLPIGVLWSFLWVLGGLTVGWFAIHIHKLVYDPSKENQDIHPALFALRKMINLKSFHGCIMFVSWINVAGRIFATPNLGQFDCYTYAVYKPVASRMFTPQVNATSLTIVPQEVPEYDKMPWANNEGGWAAGMLLGMYALAFLIGFVTVFVQTSRLQSQRQKVRQEQETKMKQSESETKDETREQESPSVQVSVETN